MNSDAGWPGQTFNDRMTYLAVSCLLAGDGAVFSPDSAVNIFGRWEPILSDLAAALQAGGRTGVYRRYHCPLSRTVFLGRPPAAFTSSTRRATSSTSMKAGMSGVPRMA